MSVMMKSGWIVKSSTGRRGISSIGLRAESHEGSWVIWFA